MAALKHLEQLGCNPLRYFTQRNYTDNRGKRQRQFIDPVVIS